MQEKTIPQKQKKQKKKGKWLGRLGFIILQLFVVALFILFFSLIWAKANYGNVSMEEIVFHLNMPAEGVSEDAVGDYLRNALRPSLIASAVYFLLLIFPRNHRFSFSLGSKEKGYRFQVLPLRLPAWCQSFILIICFFLIFQETDRYFSMTEYVIGQIQTSSFIEENYVPADSVQITFPKEKRNLICIYLESAETSSQDKANGGLFDVNYIPELTRIAKENVSFSHSTLLEGAAVAPDGSWTMAGLVAETAGLPLKLPPEYNNRLRYYEYFLPGVVSLGEILEKEGYTNYFMAGSDFSFGGRRHYFEQHGDYVVYDYLWAKNTKKIPKDYQVFWGFEDEKLFAFAKEVLPMIAAKGEPFNFSMLTVDTHAPWGYVCPLCKDTYSSQYANVWACSSAQVGAFVDWLKEQDFYDNTVVYICGDHLSMNSIFYGVNTKDTYLGQNIRKVYNAILNAAAEPVKETDRKFTTLDMFPTVLGALGVEIENERLGLGTNLFSDEETLPEKYGYEYMYTELKKKSLFFDRELLYPKEEDLKKNNSEK